MSRDKYDSVVAVNHSSLDYVLDSPMVFKAYLDKMIESGEESYYNIGSAIHCLLLEPENFDEKFVVIDYKEPANPQQKAFCEDVYKAYENGIDPASDDFNDILKLSYQMNYSVKGKSEDKIVSDANDLFNKVRDYIMFKVEGNTKTVLSSRDLETVKASVNSVVSHEYANNLIYKTGLNCTTRYEYDVFEDALPGLACKSRLDVFHIDNENKVIKIIDVKSTSKSFKDFNKSAADYNYVRQLAFYSMMVSCAIRNGHILNLEDLNGYTFEAYFVVVKTTGIIETRIFQVQEDFIFMELAKLKEILTRIKWHFDNNKWDHEMEYYTNSGINQLLYFS